MILPMKSAVERLLYLTLLLAFVICGIAVFAFSLQIHNQTKLTKDIRQSTQDITNHVDCIVVFLSQPNRGNIHITDLQNCKIGLVE